jgi:hypothetical protein
VNAIRMRSLVARFLAWILIAAVVFESFSFFCRLGRVVLGQNGMWLLLLNIESQMFFSSLAAIAPFFALLWMFSWLIWPSKVFLRPYATRIHRDTKAGRKKSFFDEFVKTIRSALDKAFRPVGCGLDSKMLMVASFVLVIIVTVSPYMPSLNSSGKFVGVDIPYYKRQLMELDLFDDFYGIAHRVFFQSPDRPLSLSLLFLGWKLTWFSAGQAVQFSPILLGLLLVLATYFFVRQAGFNGFYASLTMLFTGASYHVTVGMYGGLLANWISLVFLYLFLGFVFAGLKKGSWRFCAIALVFQSLLLFSHANTWGMSIGILGVFFLVLFLERLIKHDNSLRPLMLLVILIVGISLNILRNLALGVGLSTVEAAGVGESRVSLANIRNLWQTLILSLGSEMGISFMNPIMLFLAGLGGLAVALDNRLISRFLMVCLIASSIPFILGDQVVQTRILYDLPVHLFSIFGLLVLLNFVEQLVKDQKTKERIGSLLVLLVIFVNLNYALRCSFYLTQINFFPVK